jgi:cobalt-zinc-cadmium efflux system membrane fusion protein
LVAKREAEAAQASLDAAQGRLESAGADVTAAQAELERQQKLAATNVAATAEVQNAQSQLASALAEAKARQAEVARADEGLRLAKAALNRETAVARAEIANRREISMARSNLQNSRTALAKARENLDVANAAMQREQRIYRQNLNNAAQVQSARATVTMAETDFHSAGQALALLKSAPGGAASIEIRAPIAGVIQERKVTLGETVAADEQLFTILDLETVALDAALYEKNLRVARVGAPITVTVEALPGQSFKGIISFIGSQLDAETRTLTARAIIRNPGALRPGLFARAQLKTGDGAMSVVIPKDAVQSLEDKTVVFVPGTEERTFIAREVSVGATAEGLTAIRTGLKPGEMVVSKGAFVVKSQAMKSELAEE